MNRGIIELKLNKKFTISKGSGVMLTNNKIKYIMKVTRSLENRGILLKGTARKIISQEGGFLNYLDPLLKTGLPLIKNVLYPLAKSVLIPLGLTTTALATEATIQKNIFRSDMTALIFSNEEMEDIMKIDNLLKNQVY